MSNYQPAVPTGRPPRPAVVTAAGYMLYVVAALFAVNAIISLSTIGRVIDAAESVSSTANEPDLKSVVTGVIIGSAAINLVIVALFVVLGVFVLRGRNGMRITTWVIGGLGVLCTLCGSASGGLSSSITSSNDNLDTAESDKLRDAVPGWAHVSSILLNVIILILLILVIIFLALRSSNAFFRAPAPMQVVGYPGYPAYPAYPAPGYPGTGYPPGSPQATYTQPAYPQPGQPTYPQAGDQAAPQAPAGTAVRLGTARWPGAHAARAGRRVGATEPRPGRRHDGRRCHANRLRSELTDDSFRKAPTPRVRPRYVRFHGLAGGVPCRPNRTRHLLSLAGCRRARPLSRRPGSSCWPRRPLPWPSP